MTFAGQHLDAKHHWAHLPRAECAWTIRSDTFAYRDLVQTQGRRVLWGPCVGDGRSELLNQEAGRLCDLLGLRRDMHSACAQEQRDDAADERHLRRLRRRTLLG